MLPAEARSMSAKQLADLLLPIGHEPVRAATVHPIDMEAPVPWISGISFRTVPVAAPHAGYCRSKRIFIEFEPVKPPPRPMIYDVPLRAAPGKIHTRAMLHKLPAGTSNCAILETNGIQFANESSATETMDVLNQIASIQSLAIGHKKLPVEILYSDRLAPALARQKSNLPKESRLKEWRSPRDALKFDLASATQVGLINIQDGQRLDAPDPLSSERMIQVQIRGGVVIAYMIDGEIKRLFITRFIPPPF
jgi:hypothetical protein